MLGSYFRNKLSLSVVKRRQPINESINEVVNQFFDKALITAVQAICAAVSVMPWGVAPLDSCSMLFCWDSRPDASDVILEAIASQVGEVKESMTLNKPPRAIVGLLVAPGGDLVSGRSLEDAAGILRGLIAVGLSGDPKATENPF
jgi:hypothetical protein